MTESETVLLGRLGGDGDQRAIVHPGRAGMTYAELARAIDAAARALAALGVVPGDRVGLCAKRSPDVIAVMLATLRLGAAYVPTDPRAPAQRNAAIHLDCTVRCVVVDEAHAAAYQKTIDELGGGTRVVALGADGIVASAARWAPPSSDAPADAPAKVHATPSDLAYILYTSGSTGKPKGVTITRENAEVFIAWCHRLLRPTRADVFANHAQFNFDISVLDLFVSLSAGATLVIVPDEIGHHAGSVAELIARETITVWYSAPAILGFMGELDDLATRDFSALRALCFAGEVFPAPKLRVLHGKLPGPRYLNLYGPTETNVCTFYEMSRDGRELDRPLPIGKACDHYEARVVDEDGALVAQGAEGELQVRGPGVMVGYWNAPALTAERTVAASDGGPAWYRTGDLVVEQPDGNVVYVARRDRMIKVRGYRVEPGEIESRLYQCPGVKEAAVVPTRGPDGTMLVAHLGTEEGKRLSLLMLKEFCSKKLPVYMVPERFVFHAALPRTSTGKVDLQQLAAQG